MEQLKNQFEEDVNERISTLTQELESKNLNYDQLQTQLQQSQEKLEESDRKTKTVLKKRLDKRK